MQHTYILTQVIFLGPCDNHVILILQIEKLRLGEMKHITQYLNKEVAPGAGARTRLVLLFIAPSFF